MNWKVYAFGTITLALLVSLGFNLTGDETHFCRSTELAMHCDRLSSTGMTCYPFPSINSGYKRCQEGWEPLLTQEEKIVEIKQYKQEICNSNGCVPK